MLDSIFEQRTVKDGVYGLSLTIHENDYFMVYDDVEQSHAQEIVDNYLVHRQDDGRPDDVQIKHNKNQHLVTIYANLHYTGNDKTTYMSKAHDYINNNEE